MGGRGGILCGLFTSSPPGSWKRLFSVIIYRGGRGHGHCFLFASMKIFYFSRVQLCIVMHMLPFLKPPHRCHVKIPFYFDTAKVRVEMALSFTLLAFTQIIAFECCDSSTTSPGRGTVG